MFGFKKQETRLEDPLTVADFDDEGALNVQIDHNQVPNVQAAGLILADFAKHFAQMLHTLGRAGSDATAMAHLRAAFDAELDNPTDSPTGQLQK